MVGILVFIIVRTEKITFHKQKKLPFTAAYSNYLMYSRMCFDLGFQPRS